MILKTKYIVSIFLLLVIVVTQNSCDKEVFSGEPEALEDRSSSIYLSSDPEGASIYLDNRITGYVTPDTLKFITPGEHGIILKRKLYVDTMLVVNVDPEEMASVFIDMNSNNLNFGSIIVESDPPGASVYLNDVLTDFVTPDSIRNLIPGIYKIKCIKSEHRSDSANVLLSAQKTSNVFLTLRDTSEWVDYTMNSEGLPSNYFSDVVFYRNSMWFATKDKGLLQFNGNDWFHYPIAEYGLTSITINKLVPDNNGNLWLCINGYLVQFNNGYKEFITHEYIGQDFNDMVIDDNGTFWLATRSGLVKYDGSSWEIISDDSNNMDLTYANVLCFDANKKLYIGTATHINETGYTTSGTLVRYSGDHFDVVSMTSANYYFYAKTFTSMSLDDSGKLWAAYVLGLWSRDSRISFVNSSDSLEVYPWSQIVSNNVDSYQVNDIYSQAGNMLIALDGGLIDFNISAIVCLL